MQVNLHTRRYATDAVGRRRYERVFSMYRMQLQIDLGMIAVVGDRDAGKTRFMHVACKKDMRKNIFRSTAVEEFHTLDTLFQVVPGSAGNGLVSAVCDGADAIIVVYDAEKGARSAHNWLLRIRRLMRGVGGIHVLVCGYGVRHALGSEVPDDVVYMLHQHPNAEHAFVDETWPEGIVDCANRIVTRVRRSPPSPLSACKISRALAPSQ